VARASLATDVPAGDYRIEASFPGRSANAATSAGAAFRVERRETSTGYAGATSATYGEPIALRAHLYRSGGAAIGGRAVVFEIKSNGGVVRRVTATTAPSGMASTTLEDAVPAGSYRVSARFAGDDSFEASSASGTLDVAARTTTLAVTAPSAGSRGARVTFSATLSDAASGSRLPGKTVKFTLGDSSAEGLTGEDGRASAELALDQPPASYTVHASVVGDASHLASEATSPFEIR